MDPGQPTPPRAPEQVQRAVRVLRRWSPLLLTREARRARSRLEERRVDLEAAIEVARELPPGGLGRLTFAGLDWWVFSGRAAEALSWARLALDSPGLSARMRPALLGAIVRLEGVCGAGRTPGLADEALALARRRGLRWIEFEALYGIAGPDGVSRVPLERQREALRRLSELGPSSVREVVIHAEVASYVAARTGGLDAEAAAAARSLEWARAAGAVTLEGHIGGNLAQVQLERGDVVACGVAAAEAASAALEVGDARTEARCLGLLATALAVRGDARRAGAALGRAVVLARALGLAMAHSQVIAAAAMVALATARPGLAVRLAETSWPEPGESPAQIVVMSPFVARRLATARRTAAASRGRRGPDGGAPLAAAEALAAAAELAEALAGRDRPARLSDAGLTTREVDVLTLLAGGLSDREIAGYLAMSTKTVSVHLTHVRAKTGLRSRVELARAAGELVVPPVGTGFRPGRAAPLPVR